MKKTDVEKMEETLINAEKDAARLRAKQLMEGHEAYKKRIGAKTTESQKRAKKKYREKVQRITIDFYPSEADLLEQINKHSKKQTYIKNLIRADIEKSKKLQAVQLSTKDKIAVDLLGAFITDERQKKGFEEEYKNQVKNYD